MGERPLPTIDELEAHFPHWEKTKDLIDQCIDIMLNQAESGHPGGSRSKVHGTIVTLLSGIMRWDIRDPGKRFGDRFLLAAGHTCPAIYGALAVFNEALRIKYRQTGDTRYLVPNAGERQLTWEDLLTLRHVGGLSGHAEMAGKSLLFKYNTGPSGHGIAAAVGQAMALRMAGADEVRVFAFEGEGGLTAGAVHEAKNTAWGLGLDNLVFFIDWNDFGIDDRPYSAVVKGEPRDWFEPYGWHVTGTREGEDWTEVTRTYLKLFDPGAPSAPKVFWSRNRKGRGYHVYDQRSHGAPHKQNSENFWKCRHDFEQRYGVRFENHGAAAPNIYEEQLEQTESYLRMVMGVLAADQGLVDYLADTLVELGDSVPDELEDFKLSVGNPFEDPTITDYENYPSSLYLPPGYRAPNRAGLARFGAWINAYCHEKYGRPLVMAVSADVADSTNISGFAKGFGDFDGWGWYQRETNPTGCLLPQPITEFANASLVTGMACVNLSENPEEEFLGFLGACSTYSSFSYLKYGPFRLYSQIAQDCELKLGKTLWIASHTGPETAEDGRTHFGIFAPGVTSLFPDGHVINLHPWEHNEVPVVLGAALATDVPIIAIHLARPTYKIPDREALGMASHLDAARGAYIMKDYDPGKPREGTIIVRGTSSTNNLVELIPRLKAEGPNVKIVSAISWELFQLQDKEYRERILSDSDKIDSMIITSGAMHNMANWITHPLARKYSMSSDWDDRWRTGGKGDEMVAEARLDTGSLWEAITRFAADREKRMNRLKSALEEV